MQSLILYYKKNTTNVWKKILFYVIKEIKIMLQCPTRLYVYILKKFKASFNILKMIRAKKAINKDIKLYCIFWKR